MPENTSAMAGAPDASSPYELLKRILLGRQMTTGRLEHTLLPKSLAIPVLSADCLSSVAYTVEATLVVLVGASLEAQHVLLPITFAVAVLMTVVVASYMQTVRAYRTSGGAYVVAKENLGTTYGLIAAGSLMVGYVLTVAVSIVAGVIAITSAMPGLLHYKVPLSLFFVVFIAVANLRGVRESGLLFALPTYGFIAAATVLIAVGLWKCAGGCPAAQIPDPIAAGERTDIGILVILEAFAVGSSALTGVEAISNAVTVFRRPQGRNAAHTLQILGIVAVSLILGTAFLAHQMNVTPSHNVSVLAIIGKNTFSGAHGRVMFFMVQVFTFAILVLAANTSFQGFPRLAALMARDGYLPRQFENMGDRLVFSNGMVALAVLSALLIWAFKANVNKLIPLYAVGVFTAFTLSQAGMVQHWRRIGRRGGEEARAWRRSLAINAAGAVITTFVVLIIVTTRFFEGVWVAIAVVPFLVLGFFGIHRHYGNVARESNRRAEEVATPAPQHGQLRSAHDVSDTTSPSLAVTSNTVVLVVDDVNEATAKALGYVRSFASVRSFAGRGFHPVHLAGGEDADELSSKWATLCRSERPLEVLSAERSGADAVIGYIRALPRPAGAFVTVVIPELFTSRSLVKAVRHRTTFTLKMRLLSEPQVVITDVPLLIEPGSPAVGGSDLLRPLIPRRSEVLVLVSSASDATVRAVNYALSLGAYDTRAIYVAMDPAGATKIQHAWGDRRIPVQLDIVEAPFRDMAPPILQEVRRVTAHPGSLATVIIPELVVRRWWQRALHNQRALFLKRLLLFEPNVVLSSVPFQIG
ncbi:MAG TPA: APC family permease [Actinomycetota bacterium]|nr:APC family permease [Actinomycetota bacterium]